VVSGLTPGPVYYFALKVSDQTPNWSGLSNMAHATTHVDTGDVTPPSPVTDLEPAVHKVGVIHLRWTVPGDDGGSEYASGYDVRYSKAPFDEAAWETAIEAEYEPTPGEPGSVQTFKVSNLDPSTTYYFAMKVRDDVFNWSDISNTVSIQTAPCGGDCYPPSTGGVEVLGVTSRSLRLEWFLSEMIEWPLTYEFRMSMSPIDDWNLSEATPFNALVQYRQAGTISKYAYILVDNLSPNTTYFFSVRGADSYSNWGPAEYTSATTKYSDDPNPSGPAKFALHLEEHAGRSCGSGLPSIGTRYEIANRVDHELPYDIDVFVVVFGISGIRAAEYGLAWPSTWGTGVTSHCAAISLGDIVNSGDGLVLGWGDCQVANPVLPLSWTWLTAGEPGGIQIVAYPANQSLGVAACDCTGVAADSVFHAGVNTDPPGITIWTGGALSSWDRVRSLLE
jgi:hypothetical protein